MKNAVENAGELKKRTAGCGRNVITVTKRGRPVDTVRPAPKRPRESSEGAWVGRVRKPDELLLADQSDLWDVTRKM
ncbi:MAG: hypothetical protein ACLP59_09275 [Bryobacteraceae bacterium]